MERLKIEDIFKPGAKIMVNEIDPNDPKIKALFEETAKRQAEIKARMEWTQEDYDAMRRPMSI